jgi:RNA polymerase sigma factor (TIGR02999 family)
MVNDDMSRELADDEPDPAAPARATGDVTLILSRIEQGESQAAEQLLPLVYEELRKLASAKMAQEKPDQTLQATALVHEAYLRLVDRAVPQQWGSRRHFFAAAAEAMRRILVEQARRKAGPRAGGDLQRHEIQEVETRTRRPSVDILALHEALDRLALQDPRKAELVKLRFFAGMSNDQAAEVLGITPRTACSDWGYARAWLRVEMADQAVAGD